MNITKTTAEFKRMSARIKLKEQLIRLAAEKALSDLESQVGTEWCDAMKQYWPQLKLSRHYNCDAYVQANGFAILIEFKADIDQSSPVARAKALAQVIAYYDRILSGKGVARTPDVVFVADVNECFCLHVNYINQYVRMLDKTLPPNRQGENEALVNALVDDAELNAQSIVYHVADPDFSAEKIFNYMESLAKGIVRVVPITAATLKKGFDYFSTKILKDVFGMTANELVGRFYAFIKSQDTAVIAKGRLMGVDGFAPVAVDEDRARQFKARFGAITPDDHRELERLYDTLVGEAERRRNGQFFTPKVWVDEAHRRIANVAGEGWESTCLTWDCCCGTKSLTRDYEFENLYLSTLDPNELKCSESLNPEAKETIVLDFLNGATATLPKSLRDELKAKKDKKVVFIINPPYGQATSGTGKAHKEGVSKTAVQERMMANGMGKAANELTVQFLYRIMELVREFHLTDVVVGLFSNPSWLTGDACEAFRKEWLDMFTFDNAFGFRSEEFAGVKPGWAINFSTWRMQ